jgi:hypothetical protein
MRCLLVPVVLLLLLLQCALQVASAEDQGLVGEGEGEVDVRGVFGSNAQFFTVCSSVECCERVLRAPEHAEKLMLFVPTIHVDGDGYLSYYLGLVFDSFVTAAAEAAAESPHSDQRSAVHVLVLSLSHAMPGGPHRDAIMVRFLHACETGDYSKYSSENCTSFSRLVSAVHEFSHDGRLFHKNLAIVVLNDAVIAAAYVNIAMIYQSLHGSPLFAIVHLNHEQPWVDNQAHSTSNILLAYRKSRLVFRTHYFSDFMEAEGTNVHYLPLGPGLLQTELMALGLTPQTSRFPPVEELQQARPPSKREWLCSFAGSMKYQNRGGIIESSRAEMVEVLRDMPGCVFYPTDDAAVSAPLSQMQYMKLMMGSIFSLCPRGVGPETNRPHQVSLYVCLSLGFSMCRHLYSS